MWVYGQQGCRNVQHMPSFLRLLLCKHKQRGRLTQQGQDFWWLWKHYRLSLPFLKTIFSRHRLTHSSLTSDVDNFSEVFSFSGSVSSSVSCWTRESVRGKAVFPYGWACNFNRYGFAQGFPYGLPIECKLPAPHLLWRCNCEESGDFDRPAMKSVRKIALLAHQLFFFRHWCAKSPFLRTELKQKLYLAENLQLWVL